MKNILMIVTSHERLGTTDTKTGFWLEELAAPYQEFVQAGARVEIASPRGGKPPADPKSEAEPSAAVQAFQADATARSKLESSLRLAGVAGSNHRFFVVGGTRATWG